MAFDPNIFFQAAQMQNASRPDIFANFTNAYMIAKEKNKSMAQDIEKAAEASYIKKASGLPTTPEEDALAAGWDRIQSSKMGYDPSSGQLYPRQRSIFDQVAAPSSMAAAMPAPRPSQMGAISDDAALDSLASPFPAGFQNGSIQTPPSTEDFNAVPLSPQQLAELMGGQGPYEAAATEYTSDGPRAQQPASPAMQTAVNLRAKAQMEPDRARRNDLLKKADELEADAAIKREEAAITKQQAAPKLRQAVMNSYQKTQNLLSTIDQAIAQTSPRTAGLAGQVLSNVGGTGAADLEAILDTIGANTAFDALAEMRAASPTGGALGSITEKELALLQATQASVKQKQSPEQLKKNLSKLRDQLKSSYKRVAAAYEKDYGEPIPMDFGKEPTRQIQTPAGTVTIRRID